MSLTHRSALIALALLICISTSRATPFFTETFETYASHAAFDLSATWNKQGAPPHVLDTAFGNGSAQSLQMVPQASGSGTTNRWFSDLPTPVLPTDAAPVEFSFDFYLDASGADASWSSDWQLADVRAFSGGSFGSGALNGIVALGVSRTSTLDADTHDNAYFQGRIFAPGHTAQTYHTLDALPTAVQRSTGWHNLTARIGATSTTFFVDHLPAETVPFGLTTPISSIILGSDIASVNTFWIDNIQMEQVPEPTSLGAIACAALALRRRRRMA